MFWCLVVVVSVCVTVVSGFTVRDVATSGEQVCLTDECKRTSRFILSHLDPTVDPCVDMYKFACGGWTDKNDLPKGHGKWSTTSQMGETVERQLIELIEEEGWAFKGKNSTAVKKLKQFYKSCLDVKLIKIKGTEPLKKIFVPEEEMSEIYMTLSQFQKLIGCWIDIKKYMESIFGKGVVTPNDELIVSSQEYFKKLKNVITSTDKEVLANYIIWNLLISTKEYHDEKVSIANVLLTKLVEAMNKLDPKRTCLEISSVMLPFVTSALYVDRHFSQETVVKVVTALDDIEHQFISNLNQLTWLDEETKKNLKEKAEAMTNQVGYPDWILEPSKLDAKYKNLVIEEGEFFQNFLNSIEFHGNIEKKKVKHPPVRNMWLDSPHNVNAYYNMHENEVVVLAAILQEPIVSKDYPTSYMYGRLGDILGHELVHAFDSTGRLYDKEGNLKDNWTPHVAEEFNKRSQCFVDQYNNFTVYGQNISGLLTLAENIADNGGIKMAYRAYKSAIKPHDLPLPGLNLTNDQLFFVGASHFYCSEYSKKYALLNIYADEHAHDHFRVLGTFANSKDFAEAFNCPVNSPMNPEKKCELW